MRKLISLGTVATIFASLFSSFLVYPVKAQTTVSRVDAVVDVLTEGYEYDASRVLVKYKDGFSKVAATQKGILGKLGIETVEVSENKLSASNSAEDLRVAKTASEKDAVKDKLRELLNNPNVVYAEPNYVRTGSAWTSDATTATPNDWDAGDHWYYNLTNVPEMWKDQNCEAAGANCGGDGNIIVAVVDTGLAFESYDDTGTNSFAQKWSGVVGGKNYTASSTEYSGLNIWENSAEIPANGMDDDCNGIVDDFNGFDAYAYATIEWEYSTPDRCVSGVPVDYSGAANKDRRKEGHPVDTEGHGSFVTGMIAGVVDNGNGVVSPAHNVRIMPISANLHYAGGFVPTYFVSDEIWGVAYASDYGADVINLSLGGGGFSQFEYDIYQLVQDYGSTVVVASGNDSTNLNLVPVQYPAAYDNTIAVGAVNSDNTRSFYSNGGAELDFVAYSGEGSTSGNANYQMTLSCAPCDSADTFDATTEQFAIGTSFASPQVAAAAAIILSNNPGLEPEQVKYALIATANDIGNPGHDNDFGYGVIDFEAANLFDFDAEEKSYYPAYRFEQGGLKKAWINLANPNAAPVTVTVMINGTTQDVFQMAAGGKAHKAYQYEVGGPVEVISNLPVVTTLETEINGEPNEFKGINKTETDTTIYYPAYRHNGGDRKAWIIVGNPSTTTTANVSIFMGGVNKGNYAIAPGDRISESFNFAGGPVEVTSDIPVYSTQKYLVEESGNEMAGITTNDLGTQYYYPAYRDDGGLRKAWIIVGNPSTTTTANVDITIGGVLKGSYAIAPGERLSQDFPGEEGEVAIVDSDIDVYSTLKIRVLGYPNEMPGINASTLANEYFYPRYVNDNSSKFGWVNVGNPSDVDTANVDIYIGGVLRGSYAIAPGDRISESYNLTDGPVFIDSDNIVFSTYKVRVNNSPNEYPGILNPTP